PVTPEQRRLIALKPGGPTLKAIAELCQQKAITFCCSADVDHGEKGVRQTGILIDQTGHIHLQPKHPRYVPDPPEWPFDSKAVVYPTQAGIVGVTVCSDCTHDPYLPLDMSRMGMQILLLP